MSFFPTFRANAMYLVACFALLPLMLATSEPASAQSNTDGSLYSQFGLGELQSFPSSQAYALGGGGAALFSLNYVTVANPGTWGFQALTRASAGARYQNIEITDDAGNSSRLGGGTLNHLHFGLPILTQELGVVLAFEPYSRMNYRVQTLDSLQVSPTDDEMTPYTIDYEGTGGLQELRGGFGWRLTDNLSLGASIDFVFGILEDGRRTTFAPESGLRTSNRVDATRMRGATSTVGAHFVQGDLLQEGDGIGIGGAVTFPLQMTGTRVRTLGESLDRDTVGVAIQGDVTLPWRINAGLSYQTAERWHFVVDGTYEPWSTFTSDFDDFPALGAGGTFNDRMRLSAGAEVVPAGTDQMAGLLGRTAYRLGGYYDQAYFSPAENIELYTMAVTGGISLPTMSGGTRLDLNVEVGTRGTTDQGLVRDLFYTVSATLNIGERWFTRQQLQ